MVGPCRAGRAAASDASQAIRGRNVGPAESLSPLGVLSRGYTLTTHLDGRLIASAEELSVGEEIQSRFARGQVISRVEISADGSQAIYNQERTET